MKVTARSNYLRIAPRKVRLVVNLIRGKNIEEAQAILSFTVKRAARPLLKLLNSAIANAKDGFQLDSSNLYIYKITVDEGPKLKRWRPRSRGRAFPIQKKTSHITIVLEEIEPGKKTERKAEKKIEKKEEKKTEDKVMAKTQEKTEETTKDEKLRETINRRDTIDKGMPKPKGKGGIRRFFRRKSF